MKACRAWVKRQGFDGMGACIGALRLRCRAHGHRVFFGPDAERKATLDRRRP